MQPSQAKAVWRAPYSATKITEVASWGDWWYAGRGTWEVLATDFRSFHRTPLNVACAPCLGSNPALGLGFGLELELARTL